MEDDKRWAEHQSILDRHEKALAEVRESVKASISTITSRLVDQGEKLDKQSARLDEIEASTMDQAEKIDKLVNETAGQSVLLSEIKSNLCAHKEQQAQDFIGHGKKLDELNEAKGHSLEKIGKIEGTVADLGVALRGKPTEGGEGGLVGDMALVKRAVVRPAPEVWGKRVLYGLVAIAAICVSLAIVIRPDSIPLFMKFLERGASGH